MSNTIHLPIQAKWFDMILSGEKTEEYRSLTKHWAKRVTNLRLTCINSPSCFSEEMNRPGRCAIKYGKKTVTLTNGYNPTSRRIVVELLGLEIKTPNPAWCPPGTEGLWFALKLGRLLETKNL